MTPSPAPPLTIHSALAALATGHTTSLALTRQCLANIEDPVGQGAKTFINTYRAEALAAAQASDARRAAGLPMGRLAGIPISIKDLFDVAGEPTTAGSLVLRDAPPATRDAAIVTCLREAGAIIIGKTNMTEFAYSGIGINPHYGTPLSPYHRNAGHVPGGSSSGAAVSVADGMALGAIGSDTGGSTRIPAAFCGLTGFKPSRQRVSTAGVFPLAPSFDSIGPIAHNVADCRLLDEVLSGQAIPPKPIAPRAIRLGLSLGLPLSGLHPQIAAAFETALKALREAGVTIDPTDDIDWSAPAAIMRDGRLSAVECLAAHGPLFEKRDRYDQRVATRIATALGFPAADYARQWQKLKTLRETIAPKLARFDAVIMPTVACGPPLIESLADDDAFLAANSLALRNTMIANMLDGCAISLPMSLPGQMPSGLMLMAPNGADHHLFDIAQTVETLI